MLHSSSCKTNFNISQVSFHIKYPRKETRFQHVSTVSLWQGDSAFKHWQNKIIFPSWQGRHLQCVMSTSPLQEDKTQLCPAFTGRPGPCQLKLWSHWTVRLLITVNYCSVHAQQGCFSLAEYTAHTRTQGYRSSGRKILSKQQVAR